MTSETTTHEKKRRKEEKNPDWSPGRLRVKQHGCTQQDAHHFQCPEI
jgi:hypothetical protein